MSVVIIGGNERMERKYKELCSEYNCKAKVFTKKSGKISAGRPDMMIFFTDTVSHKMVFNAKESVKGQDVRFEHCHSSSASALRQLLERTVPAM